MKVGIIGDVHYGASYKLGKKSSKTNINSRLMDFHNTLIETIDSMVEKDVEVIVFTGDIFEHRYPSIVQQKLFSRALRHAISSGISKIYIVVGNHDQQTISSTITVSYLSELKLGNIVVVQDLDLFDVDDNAQLVAMPYMSRRSLGAEDYKDGVKLIQEKMNKIKASLSPNKRNFLVGHMAIEGTFFEPGTEEYYTQEDLMLPVSLFKGIDHTIMGHVHKPMIMSKSPLIEYVGSMDKTSHTETHKKIFMIYDTTDGSVERVEADCKDIFKFETSYIDASLNSFIMDKIKSDISSFFAKKKPEDSIISLNLNILVDDWPHVSTQELEKFLYENIGVGHVVMPIGLKVKTKNVARNTQSLDKLSDEDAFSKYAKKAFVNSDLLDDIIEIGKEIISGGSH